MSLKRLNQSGYTFVELAMALMIMAAMVSSVSVARKFMAKQVQNAGDKAYASQKALQMFEELKALVGGGEQIAVLDDFSDGSGYNTVLTTDKNVDVSAGTKNPADPLSGNRLTNGNWRYLRQVFVSRIANDPNARQVYVKVFLYGGDNNPTSAGPMLSSVGGILRTIVGLDPPTQVMDLYVLDIQNTQAWWGILPSLSTMMDAVISNIGGAYGAGRNPGLQIRPHYIVRNSFGRDSQYIPFINQSKGTDQKAVSWVYLYPGLAPEDSGLAGEQNFYDPSNILQTGNFNVDGGIINTSTSQLSSIPNVTNWTVSDQFNHGMRYPDEMAAYKAVTTAAVAKGVATPDISYRMLIEQMNSSPQSFTNAVIMNLHGEVVPLPPMRNYSDPAKDPGSQDVATDTNIRVVTHPELIYYPVVNTSTVSVKLRVYAYYDGLSDMTTLDTTYPNNKTTGPVVPGISILLPDLFVTSPNIAVTAIVDKWGASTTVPVTYVKEGLAINTNDATDSLTNPTKWNAQTITGTTIINGVSTPITQTLITLYNTRLRCPIASGNNSGLPVSFRLYNSEYIPCSPEMTALSANSNPTFTAQDLSDASASHAKNTARWVITLSGIPVSQTSIASGPVTCHEVDTRIGTAVTTNVAPPNLSKTYFWVGNTNPPPTTEQYQFLGDPRDCPYLDVKVGGETVVGQAVTIEKNGYNWWFKNLNATTDGYTGFGQAGNRTGWNNTATDLPRYFQMLRNGVMKSTAIWTTLNGFSFFYHGLGGEFGFDHPPYNNGITFLSTNPWYSTTGHGADDVNEIVNWNANVLNNRVIACTASAGTTHQWYSKPWLGELYPDSMYSCWQTIGNLPSLDNTSGFANFFYRADYSGISNTNPWTTATDTQNGFSALSYTRTNAEPGCASFFNGGDASGYNFMHDYDGGDTGNLTSLGATIYTNFQYSLPNVVALERPWTLHSTSSQPPEWGIAPYLNTKTTLSIPNISSPGAGDRIFYGSNDSNSGTWYGSGVVQMNDSTNTYQGYVVETGTSPSANVGSVDLAKTMLVVSLRAFVDGGQMAVTGAMGHIHQLPLVELYPVLSGGASVTINPVPQYSNPTTIKLEAAGPLTDNTGVYPQPACWFSFPSVTPPANFYTQEYPGYNSGVTGILTNSTYSEADTLVYNFKWGTQNPGAGGKLYFINTSPKVAATVGVYNASYAVTNSIPVTGILQDWNVSDTVMYPNGTYWVTVETYRQGIPLHYATHSIELTINR